MRVSALVLAGWVGLVSAACAPAPMGSLLVTNQSTETFFLVISGGRDGTAFYRIDPGAHGLAASPDPTRPRTAVVVYSAACEAFRGSSDTTSERLVIGPDGAVRFEAGSFVRPALAPLPADPRCRR
jgi:hypothetical protein